MRIVISPEARSDLDEADQFIARDNPEAADRMLERVVEVVGLLALGLMQGHEARLRSGRKVQVWPVPPYRIYYSVRAEDFEVVRVYHQTRRPIEKT